MLAEEMFRGVHRGECVASLRYICADGPERRPGWQWDATERGIKATLSGCIRLPPEGEFR